MGTMSRVFVTVALLSCLPLGLRADFSYEETTKFTGGAMAGALKFASVFSKKLREPMRATVAVKGNRLIQAAADSSQIIDMDAETITEINHEKKTYSVVTFAEMMQAMQAAAAKMGDAQKDLKKEGGDVKYKISVKETGQTREISGYLAKEIEMKAEAQVTDQKSGQSGSLDMLVTSWLAPKVAGYEEVTAFYQRMAQKMAFTPSGMRLAAMGQAQMQNGLVQIQGEMAKMDGLPLLEIVRMGVADGAAGQQQQSAPPPPSVKESLGGALGGALGGFGGLGRRRKQKEEPRQEGAAPPPQASSGPASLMEMTTERSGFSSAPVDPAKFQIPAGYAKTEHPMLKMAR